ncbi:MAG TPA: hypothetical protein VK689_16085 [Armatimonadota bacterium]|nr:hypothetical protein [Armatimonadota bacterium]
MPEFFHGTATARMGNRATTIERTVTNVCEVKCEVRPGLIESERTALVPTAEGHKEEVTVSDSEVSDDGILAAFIGKRDGNVLIELSRESSSGRWRLWVPEQFIVSSNGSH